VKPFQATLLIVPLAVGRPGAPAHAGTLAEKDSAERAVNKLGRTFAALVEAFKRYRNGGEQKVTVQHMSIAEGGQAVVGNVTRSAREPKLQRPAKLALTDARQPAAAMVQERARVKVALRRS
jgi:hypothetical protein